MTHGRTTVDDDRLSALIAEAVKELLSREQARLGKLLEGFLAEASKTERELVRQIEDSRDRFEVRRGRNSPRPKRRS
jgi:hypothetical protein